VRKEKIRLYEINAPEIRGIERPKGLKSRNFLKGQILRKEITIETIKDKKGKYERYIGKIWLKNEKRKEININDFFGEKMFCSLQRILNKINCHSESHLVLPRKLRDEESFLQTGIL